MRNSAMSLLLSTGLVFALAKPAHADIYQGSGQVVSGPGAGQVVSLTVDFDGQNLRTLAGPPLEGAQKRVEARGDSLEITVFRGNQVIHYHLVRTR
jgi:hypothetical protein